MYSIYVVYVFVKFNLIKNIVNVLHKSEHTGVSETSQFRIQKLTLNNVTGICKYLG